MDENIEKRLQFALSIILLALINLIFREIFNYIIDKIEFNNLTRILVTYVAAIIGTVSAAIIVFYIISKSVLNFEKDESTSEKQSLTIKENIDPNLNLLFQGFTFKNFGSQLKTALILICIIYIPLDAFSNIIPLIFDLNVLEFQADTLSSTLMGEYLLYDINLMIITTIIIHFTVAMREEFMYRGFYIFAGEKKMNKSTTFIYTACLFGLAHFTYIIPTIQNGDPIFYPIWWGFVAGIIGITSAYYYITKKQLWPLIIAHWTNNVISAIIIRQDIDGASFWIDSFLKIYVPIIALGIVLFIVNRKTLIKHIKGIYDFFRDYFIETPKKSYFGVDVGIIIIIWIFTLI